MEAALGTANGFEFLSDPMDRFTMSSATGESEFICKFGNFEHTRLLCCHDVKVHDTHVMFFALSVGQVLDLLGLRDTTHTYTEEVDERCEMYCCHTWCTCRRIRFHVYQTHTGTAACASTL